MKIITTHPNADLDSFGGIVALRLLYPESYVFFPGAQEMALKNLLSTNIYKFNEISLKEIEKEEIEKIIIVDVEDLERIGKLYGLIISQKIPIEIYDHHPEQRGLPNWSVVYSKNYGAVSTLLAEILREKGIEPSPLEASLILLGIYEDTGSFHFQETTEEDFEMAGWLLSKGANLNLVHRFLIQELTPDHINILEQFYKTKEEINLKGYQITFCYASLPYFVEDIAFVVHRFVDILGKEIFFGFIEQEGKIYLIGRSRNELVNLSKVFKELGGGGHGGAGSAILKNTPFTQAKAKVISLLNNHLPSKKIAKDIMNKKVYFVNPKTKIVRALEKMNYYHINAMPVISKGKIYGSITRQLIDRALSHGLKNINCEDIMDIEVPTVQKDTPLEEFKAIISGKGKRFLLVKDGEKVVGIITRMDIYKSIIEKEDIRNIAQEKVIDVKRIMEQNLPPNIWDKLKKIGEVSEELSMEGYLVGGTVRDLLLSNPSSDIDVVIEGNGIKVGEKIAKLYNAKFKTHLKFLTGKLYFNDGTTIDIATARKERYGTPASLPDVEASLIYHDLGRRDFTINAMVISLNPKSFGKLKDLFNGLQDLRSKTIKVLHSLSFIEDPTRAFRAVRLCEKLKFKLSSVTEKLIKIAINQGAFENLSGNRLWEEFSYILELPEPYSSMEKLEGLGLIKVIHPSIKLNKKIEEFFSKTKEILDWAKIEKINVKYWQILYLLSLSINLKEEDLFKISLRLNLNKIEEEILKSAKNKGKEIFYKLKKTIIPSDIFKALRNYKEIYLFWSLIEIGDEEVKEKIKDYIKKYSKIKTEIKGKDLIERGIKPSSHLGNALEETLFAKIDGKVKTKEEELKFALSILKKN